MSIAFARQDAETIISVCAALHTAVVICRTAKTPGLHKATCLKRGCKADEFLFV
ncbi:MAG: hypothetical protein L0Z73_05385 [Gammaproteobacteria bacterium]|nr:hypothetical protein [Gammaproteobacteria bacterium]